MNQNGEPTITDVLDAINTFSGDVEKRFDAVDERFEGIDQRFASIDQRFDGVEMRFDALESDIAHIKERLRYVENEVRALGAQMVTKQYLDAKFDELLVIQQKDSLFKRTLLLALEQAKAITPEARAKLEALIP